MLTLNVLTAIGSTATSVGRPSGLQTPHDPFDAVLTATIGSLDASGRAAPDGTDTGKTTSWGKPTPQDDTNSGSKFLNLPPFWLGLPAMQTGGEVAPPPDSGTDIGVRIPPPPGDGSINAGGQEAADSALALGVPTSSDATAQDGDGPSGPPDTSDGTEIAIGIPTSGSGDVVSETPANLSIMETGAAFSVSLAADTVNEQILNDLFETGNVTDTAA